MKTLKDINWNQVYYFYEVARKLSMKDAGKLLGVSTPTVSEQIKKLETLIGVPLFVRYPRRIELTNEGVSLFACAREMFEAGGRFLDTVSPDSIGGYAVRVGIQESLSTPVALDFVNQYWDLYAPYGTVNTFRETLFEHMVEKLIQGKFDWCLSFEKPRMPRLNHQEITSVKLVFCCAPWIFRKFKHREDILRSLPVSQSSWGPSLNETIADCFREAEIFPDETIMSDHDQYIIQLAKRGRCVAILPEETVKSAAWGSDLMTFELGQQIFLPLYAVWPKGHEKMISIKKLVELVSMSEKPEVMSDPDLQIRVGEVKDSMLELN